MQPQRIDIGTRHIGRGHRERVQPKLPRRSLEPVLRKGHLHRRIRVVIAARPLERVAAFADVAPQVARRAADAADLLEIVEMRLQLLIGDAVVLHRHPLGQRAIAFLVMAFRDEIRWQETVSLAVPMHARAAHSVARQEGPPVPHRQRRLCAVVAESDGGLRGFLKHAVAPVIAQLVLREGGGEILGRVAPRAAFQCQHLHPGGGQLLGVDRPGPAETDQNHVDLRKLLRHRVTSCLIQSCSNRGGPIG